MAEDREAAETTLAVFEKQYGAKYGGAVECLTKDRDALLACMTSPPSTEIACGQRIRARVCSSPSGIARSAPKGPFRRKLPH